MSKITDTPLWSLLSRPYGWISILGRCPIDSRLPYRPDFQPRMLLTEGSSLVDWWRRSGLRDASVGYCSISRAPTNVGELERSVGGRREPLTWDAAEPHVMWIVIRLYA